MKAINGTKPQIRAMSASKAKMVGKPNPLQLFQENLVSMREWYRQQPGRGVETGHLVMLELCLADVIAALSAAMEGKAWQPPSA